ncbi:MAG: hypothetical protein LOY03_12140 [Cyclobacteriaceae bacterium]|nr:hypothetical protein [Cyclobacteriaceae bacterium]
MNLTELLVALTSSLTFLSIIGMDHWNVVTGLILGGVVAAPLAALVAK